MRVAALYDIHANIHALEATLRDVDELGVDLIVIGGDVAWGPFPLETIERLRALGDRALFVRGNADREVAWRLTEGLGPEEAAVTGWCADRIDAEDRAFLMSFPEAQILEVDGLGPARFCHGSPRSDEEKITPATPDRRLRGILDGVAERAVVCGHTHMQFDRMLDGWRVVNAGSIGMPYEGRRGAFWALLGPDVDLRCTPYDFEEAARAMHSTGCPRVEEIFASGVLDPETPEAAIAAFEPAE